MLDIIILAAAYIISHFYRSFMAVLSPYLTAELGMSPAHQSDALGAWFTAFALSQFLVGIMLDKFGPKWTTASLFGVLAGGGGMLFAFAHSASLVMVAMVLMGIGCAPVLMASLYLFKRIYAGRKFATLTASFIAIGLAGNVLGSSPLAWAAFTFGWRTVLMGLAVITVLLSLLMLVFMREPPRADAAQGQGGGYWDILKRRELWFIFPFIFVNYGVVTGLRGLWAGPYFSLLHDMNANQIGSVLFWVAVSMAIGSFLYGPVDRIFNTRKWVVVVGACMSWSCLCYWLLHPSLSVVQVCIALTGIGVFSLFFGLLMAQATANVPAHLTGRGVTLVNFFNMGGVGAMQWASSEIYRRTSNVEDPALGFESVLLFYAVAYFIVLVIYLFSKDVKPEKAG